MEIPASSDILSCSCNSVTLTFRSSLFSRYLSISLPVSSKATRRLHEWNVPGKYGPHGELFFFVITKELDTAGR